mmetsp:Transcript_54790/g.63003  ORF Transcript_54790/g.63003 Transcript_54790/m.63003 type:complete len:334 (+) Transcript_54790:45-1046(+)
MGGICSNPENSAATPKKDPKIYSCEINGIVYEVLNGDMCYEQVDAIVNSANSQLNHNTGISGSIIIKGGSEIQDESNKLVQENGSLTVGDVVATGSGKLNCKHVIHAVLPIWIGGELKEEEKLIEAITNTLAKADALKVSSLAFPALGGGVFGFPRDMAAEITVQNCVKYFRENQNSSIKLVKFMSFDLPTLNFFTHELRKTQGEKSMRDSVVGSRTGSVFKKELETEASHKKETASSSEKHEVTAKVSEEQNHVHENTHTHEHTTDARDNVHHHDDAETHEHKHEEHKDTEVHQHEATENNVVSEETHKVEEQNEAVVENGETTTQFVQEMA